MKNQRSKIVYFYDALCGWCYGFSPVIQRIHEVYAEKFDFEIISGGLKLGDGVGPIGVVAPYIKAGAYKVVEERCGVTFGEEFVKGPLEEGKMILNSLPPAIALSIVKDQKPEEAFAFASVLHKAIYVDGLHPENIAGYGTYASNIGLNAADFVVDMQKSTYEELAQSDFQLARHFGINGFPAMIGIKEETAYMITRGYVPFESVASLLDSFG